MYLFFSSSFSISLRSMFADMPAPAPPAAAPPPPSRSGSRGVPLDEGTAEADRFRGDEMDLGGTLVPSARVTVASGDAVMIGYVCCGGLGGCYVSKKFWWVG